MPERRIVLPLSDTATARATVDYAVQAADGGELHVVIPLSGHTDTPEGGDEHEHAEALLDRASAWVAETSTADDLEAHFTILAEDAYVFGPEEYAASLRDYATKHGITEVVIDPGYWVDTLGPLLAPFETALQRYGFHVEEAPVARSTRYERIGGRIDPIKIGSLFVATLAFYLLLGDPLYWFDWITGITTAALVATIMSNITFGRAPRFPESIYRNVRFVIYLPYLGWEIIKANFTVALVILHPRMSIDPTLTRVNAKVPGGLPLLTLANSITLTPGTLTVHARDQRLIVHTLLPSAREDLFDGRLERAVRFVFFGREHADIASPRARGDTEIIHPESDEG